METTKQPQNSHVADFFSSTATNHECVVLLQTLREQVEKGDVILSREDQWIVLENVGHADSRIREECLLLLAETSRSLGRLAALSRLLDDFEPIRMSALEVLEECGEAQDQRPVEFVLENDLDWAVRASAVSCLAGMAGAGAKAAIVQTLEDEHSSVRRYAASALARIADGSDIPVLLRAEARETEPGARTGIYGALYQLGDFTYLQKMIALIDVDAEDDELVNVACQVLNSLTTFVFPGDVPFVRSEITALNVTNAHPAVRACVLQLLKVLGEDEAEE